MVKRASSTPIRRLELTVDSPISRAEDLLSR